MILIIDRSDGRGFSFPGGLAFPWEAAEQVMRREVMEETGLLVGESALLFEYKTAADIPCIITVFEAEASGEITESWEGTPRWLGSRQIKPSILPSQKEIIDRIV